MYTKITQAEIKQVASDSLIDLKEALVAKNMSLEDVNLIISMEFKDPEKPSKTYIQFQREMNKKIANPMDALKEALSGMSDLAKNENLTEQEKKAQMIKALELAQESNKENEGKLDDLVFLAFKKMMNDPDNELCLFATNQFINFKRVINVKKFSELPSSLQERIKTELKY